MVAAIKKAFGCLLRIVVLVVLVIATVGYFVSPPTSEEEQARRQAEVDAIRNRSYYHRTPPLPPREEPKTEEARGPSPEELAAQALAREKAAAEKAKRQ